MANDQKHLLVIARSARLRPTHFVYDPDAYSATEPSEPRNANCMTRAALRPASRQPGHESETHPKHRGTMREPRGTFYSSGIAGSSPEASVTPPVFGCHSNRIDFLPVGVSVMTPPSTHLACP